MARPKVTTSKKQKFVGVQEFVNAQTGEVVPMQVTRVDERDFNFHKVWLQHLIASLDEITNRKMELAFWIIENLNRENQLVMTQRQISDKSGISLTTVRDTMKLLQQGSPAFLVRINGGAYMVNPDVIYKGSHNSRMGIVFDYGENATTNTSEPRSEEQASNITTEEQKPSVDVVEGQTTIEDTLVREGA